MKERDPQVALDQDVYEWVRKEAVRNRRTIKGQLEVLVEKAMRAEQDISAGKTQINADKLRRS